MDASKYSGVSPKHFTPPFLISNCRRVSSKKYRDQPNWVIAMELFGIGSNTAHQICRDWGLDPDGVGRK